MAHGTATQISSSRERGTAALGVGTLRINARAKALVLEALNNNRLSYGPLTQRFEHEFARAHGCRFGIMSNSGTSALQIALQAMKELHGWEDGDDVIVPAVTFVATANIVLHNRMRPVLVDVDPRCYELDPNLLEARITPRTRCMIPVHLFGQPADMGPILEIARRRGLKVIEDSCETMFAACDGKTVGALGDIGCFSTYVAHLLVTGVGGINTTNDSEYAVRLRSLMNHGRDSIYISIDDDDGRTDEELRMVVAKRFKFVSIGHSFRVTELEAALGLAQLEEWQSIIAARRANAGSLMRKLAHLQSHLQLPATRPGSEHSFMMFPIVLREEPKGELVQFLERHGVETRDMLPLTNQPVYQKLLGWREDDYAVAKWINESGFYVGCHQDLTEADLDYVGEVLEGFFRRRPRRIRQGACLIVSVTTSAAATLAQTLDELPWDLFERVVAVGTPVPPDIASVLEQRGVEVLPVDTSEVLLTASSGTLGVEEESLVFLTGDGRHNPRDVGRLLLALERGNDMVVASRFVHGGARQGRNERVRYRSLGNRIFTLLANLVFFGNFSDTLCSLRAVRRRRLIEAAVDEEALPGLYQLSIEAMRRGWKVAELPIVELVPGESSERKRIFLSILPLTRVLMKEWRRARRG